MFKTILVAAIGFVSISAAYADAIAVGPTLIAPTGKVLVNQGQGFMLAADGQTLKFNDRIMVSKGAAVTLAYAKCSLLLKEGTLLTLPKGDLCGKTADATLANSDALLVQPVAGSETGAGGGGAIGGAQLAGLGFAAGTLGLALGETTGSFNKCTNAVSAC